MSAGVRVAAAEAALVAAEMIEALAASCDRIEIAGSLRRGTPDVGDIELVAVPRGLWAIDDTVARLVADGIVERLAGGARYTKLRHVASGLQIDLFTPSVDRFGLILLLRTGPAEYSRRFVTALRRIGLHVGNGELHRGGWGSACGACPVIEVPEESAVYAAAAWAFVAPDMRA